MREFKVTGKRIHKGGQYAGTPPQLMRVEYVEDSQPMIAVEMYIGFSQSQHKARQAAITVIEMLIEELRY